MSTTGDVVDQHLKGFGEHDIDGVLAAYSSDKKIVSKLRNAVVPVEGENKRPVTSVTIEEVCTLEWSIGGPARTTGTVPALAAGKK